jgi:hypothetical protein
MSGRWPVVKIIAESLSQHDEKHVLPTPLCVGKGRKKKTNIKCQDGSVLPPAQVHYFNGQALQTLPTF